MPIAKPKPRIERVPRQTVADKRSETIRVRQWWDAFALEWAWIGVIPEALRLLRERDHHIRLHNLRNKIVETYDAIIAVRGHSVLTGRLSCEVMAIDSECARYYAKHAGLETQRMRAFDQDDTVEKVARTLLIQHGVNPNRLRRGAERDKAAERVTAALREKYAGEIKMWSGLRAEVAQGARHTAGGEPLTEPRIEKIIADLKRQLGSLPD